MFLPQWAHGIQAFANLTTLSVKGSNTADFSGFNPRSISWGASLTRPRFVVKFDVTMQKEVRRTLVAENATTGIPPNTYQWFGEITRPSLSGEYRFARRVAVFAVVRDFLGGLRSPTLVYSRDANTPEYARVRGLAQTGANITLGIKADY